MANRVLATTAQLRQAAADLSAATSMRNSELMHKAIESATIALNNLCEYVAEIKVAEINPCTACGRKGIALDVAAKTVAYMSKTLNESVRLLEFCKGNADSRMQIQGGEGLSELLKLLSQDQFQIVMSWMEENEKLNAESVTH